MKGKKRSRLLKGLPVSGEQARVGTLQPQGEHTAPRTCFLPPPSPAELPPPKAIQHLQLLADAVSIFVRPREASRTTPTHAHRLGLSQGSQSQAQKPSAGGASMRSPPPQPPPHEGLWAPARVPRSSRKPTLPGVLSSQATVIQLKPLWFCLGQKCGEASGLREASQEPDSSALPMGELCDFWRVTSYF